MLSQKLKSERFLASRNHNQGLCLIFFVATIRLSRFLLDIIFSTKLSNLLHDDLIFLIQGFDPSATRPTYTARNCSRQSPPKWIPTFDEGRYIVRRLGKFHITDKLRLSFSTSTSSREFSEILKHRSNPQ